MIKKYFGYLVGKPEASKKVAKRDIPLLLHYFLDELAKYNIKKRMDDEVVNCFLKSKWGIRGLRDAIERLVVLSDSEDGAITVEDFENYGEKVISDSLKKDTSLREIEKRSILERVIENDWNLTNTARSLNMSRTTLYSKLRIHNIPYRDLRAAQRNL